MARLQILELPSGNSDERPPFLLVIDQVNPDDIKAICAAEQTAAELIGARAIFSFAETVEIPANEPMPSADDPERAGTAQIVYAHERTRLDLCSALLVSGDTTWRKLIETVGERQRELAGIYRKLDGQAASGSGPTLTQAALKHTEKPYSYSGAEPDGQPSEAIEQLKADLHEARMWARHGYEIGQRHCGWADHGVAPDWLTEGWPRAFESCEHLKQAAAFDEALTRVRNLPTEPEVMNSEQERPDVWLHGYKCGVLAAKSAARPRDEEARKP